MIKDELLQDPDYIDTLQAILAINTTPVLKSERGVVCRGSVEEITLDFIVKSINDLLNGWPLKTFKV